jgi:hypothetical protein
MRFFLRQKISLEANFSFEYPHIDQALRNLLA